MQQINQLFYLVFAVLLSVMSFNSLIEKTNKKEYQKSHVYWTRSVLLMALSCFSWAIAPSTSLFFLTVANTCLMASLINLAILLRTLNLKTISKSLFIFYIILTLLFGVTFEILRLNHQFVARGTLSSIFIFFIVLQLIYEAERLLRKDPSFSIKSLLVFFGLVELLVLLRVLLVANGSHPINHLNNIYAEPFILFGLRISLTVTLLIVFVTLNNYFHDHLWKKANAQALANEAQLIHSLCLLAKARDNETGRHIVRTQEYMKTIALSLRTLGYYVNQLSDGNIDLMYKAAPLHDIGKIGIPDDILLKASKLDDKEWEIMKTHVTIGENVLSNVLNEYEDKHDLIHKAFNIVAGHHEKWDGTGYPRGLSGHDIPLEGRIMALADVYDALMSKRPYKKHWSHEEAVRYIANQRNIQFDPLIVDAFLVEADRFNEINQACQD